MRDTAQEWMRSVQGKPGIFVEQVPGVMAIVIVGPAPRPPP
ncbi:MAG: hypothetical protein OXL97_00675 [Chloroflexota bacterium]|nr:hypothetical protein [Chloroflexota bacterium]MDE2883657.1 hypothetical protein [Chloroflexota bacterium]